MNEIALCRGLFAISGGFAAFNLALSGLDVIPTKAGAVLNAFSAGLTAFTAVYCVKMIDTKIAQTNGGT